MARKPAIASSETKVLTSYNIRFGGQDGTIIATQAPDRILVLNGNYQGSGRTRVDCGGRGDAIHRDGQRVFPRRQIGKLLRYGKVDLKFAGVLRLTRVV